MKKKLIILLVVFAVMGSITGCRQSPRTMKGCLAYYNSEIPKVLDAQRITYTVDVKPQTVGTYQGYHYIECNVLLNGDLTYQQIFEALKSVESIEKPEKALVNHIFQYRGNDLSIDNYCLKLNDKYVYSTINSKSMDDLTLSEKLSICEWIQGQYVYYDNMARKYTGSTYSEKIYADASELFGFSEDEIKIIELDIVKLNMYPFKKSAYQ